MFDGEINASEMNYPRSSWSRRRVPDNIIIIAQSMKYIIVNVRPRPRPDNEFISDCS